MEFVAVFQRPDNQFGEGMGICLKMDVPYMRIDRTERNIQLTGDHFTAFGFYNQENDFFLPGAKFMIVFHGEVWLWMIKPLLRHGFGFITIRGN